MARPGGCYVCGEELEESRRLVLVVGKAQRHHCSQTCVRVTVRRQRRARVAAGWRGFLSLVLLALLVAGAGVVWQRFYIPHPQSISFEPPEVRRALAAPGAVEYGPAWPPTDEDWMMLFEKASWIYPLPGPIRRPLTIDGRIFGPDPPKNHPAVCRIAGHCGVDLGGDLWGEHVYAAQDGVVEAVQRSGNDERGGIYVRLSHFGGMVFTSYFHLAAIPRHLGRGVPVSAGQVIGLVGDTGLEGPGRHLHFALSVRPSKDFSEVYWDPKPLMAWWPLEVPAHGTVAGLVSGDKADTIPRFGR